MKPIDEQLHDWEKGEGKALFERMHWRKDAKILDYGCGYGHYSIALSKTLNTLGKVYAVDINKGCLKELALRVNEEALTNIEIQEGREDYKLDFPDEYFDVVMYYDILHGGESGHKETLLSEAHRVLRDNATLSILPFHLANFRDREGNKKKYSYAELIHEVREYGYELIEGERVEGLNFEKCHSSYQLSKGEVELEGLERAEILNFMKI